MVNTKWVPSPNYTKGRNGYKPLVIVCHIMEGTLVGTDNWFRNRQSGVSAHFGVGKKGQIHQYVQVSDTAWHAGSVRNPLIKLPYPSNIKPNLYTIGIEFEGYPGESMSEEQYQAGLELIKELLTIIPDDRSIEEKVIGHYQINSIDKSNCPGPSFPWARLYKDLTQPVGPAVFVEKTGEYYPAEIKPDGRMWSPIRAIAEAAGLEVNYDSKTKITTLK